MKRLLLTLVLALAPGACWAQDVMCPTRPAGDSSNACASTAFVGIGIVSNFASPPPLGNVTPSQVFSTVLSANTSALFSPGGTPLAFTADTSPWVFQNSGTTAQSVYGAVSPFVYWDNVRSTVVVPSGTTISGNVNAFGAYVVNNSTANAVGFFSNVQCSANGSSCWGANFTLNDKAGSTGQKLAGLENDITFKSSSSTGTGLSVLGSSTVQPAGADAYAVGSLSVQSPGTAYWTHGFVCNDNTSTTCLFAGLSAAAGASISSTPILFNITDSSSVGHGLLESGIPVGTVGAFKFKDNIAANYIVLETAPTGVDPAIFIGGDTNRNLQIFGSGTGGALIRGMSSGTGTPAGYIGEQIQALVPIGSAVPMTSTVPKDVATLVISAGIWQCSGAMNTVVGASTVTQTLLGGIGTVANVLPNAGVAATPLGGAGSSVAGGTELFGLSTGVFNVSTATTLHLIMTPFFTTSTLSAYGNLNCIRSG